MALRRVPDEHDYEGLVEALRTEFPRLRLVPKHHSLLQRSIHHALRLLTLGGQSSYLEDYVTTIGARIYLPPGWMTRSPADRMATLRHERVHLRQFARLGVLLMGLLYLLVPLPIGFAWFRMRFEREAYEESIRATWELSGPEAVLDPRYRAHVVSVFVGPAYGWMWVRRSDVERWYDGVVAGLVESRRLR